VTHAAAFPALEDEMCAFGAAEAGVGKDRVDALVWAITELLIAHAEPRVRVL
jgi:phage terminase large subunit-like protein